MRAARGTLRVSVVIAASLVLAGAASATAGGGRRAASLQEAWADPAAMRSVLFVRGMTCRACTLLLDRRLAATPGIYWSRFNYPLRLFVVHHDPKTASLRSIRELIGSTGELATEVLATGPSASFGPAGDTDFVSWKGGAVGPREARGIPERFLADLDANGFERGQNEFDQVLYEILGEEVRNRVFASRAAAAGYRAGPAGTPLPTVVAREFYYPESELETGPAEAGVARFLLERVLLGDEGEAGRERFDSWLLQLWREIGLDFRGEYLEVSAGAARAE